MPMTQWKQWMDSKKMMQKITRQLSEMLEKRNDFEWLPLTIPNHMILRNTSNFDQETVIAYKC